MRAKWEQYEKEGLNPFIWVFVNGNTFSIRDNSWIKQIKQNYFISKIKKGDQIETDQIRNKK